ncbi:MAG: BamA/TamA family outer membrane protein [Bacteroidales bacterium]|nr:BamA/TamA family outer membrane protein [Bacteroidales bacterium]
MTRTAIFTAIFCFAFLSNVFGQDIVQDTMIQVEIEQALEVKVEQDGEIEVMEETEIIIQQVVEEVQEEISVPTPEPAVTMMSSINPRTFEIGGITVMGSTTLDPRSIMLLAGLEMGEHIQIPGDRISSAIDRLWRQGSFGNIEIYATHIIENRIFLVIALEELPRINTFEITGVRRFEANRLRDELEIRPNEVLSENRLNRLRTQAVNHFRERGFLNTRVTAIQRFDTLTEGINLTFEVDRGQRVKISSIEIIGNEATRHDDPNESFRPVRQAWRWAFSDDLEFSDARIRRNLSNTKQRNFFRFWKRSRFVEPDFREDLRELITAYNSRGFRDFQIVHDTLIVVNDRRVKLQMEISEGNRYFFGDISFVGNTKYPDEFLAHILNIHRGDVFDNERLQRNLSFNPQQGDIFSLYTDDGYLAFNAFPVEVRIENDTVDIEIRIREGNQFRINRVGVEGNTRTNDHVIIRELRVVPGQLFSRANLINSMNSLRMMRYFDDASIHPDVRPSMVDETADIIFSVEEIGSDQVELSGGWGGGMIVGTLGFAFNNFSIQNIFRRDRWRPLPSGDGQRLTIRGQSNGHAFHSVSVSFMEPWLGGRRPFAFSISGFTTMQSNGLRRGHEMRGDVVTTGVSIGLGQRLRWPDMFFTLHQSLNFQHYNIHNFSHVFPVDDGRYNNFSYTISLNRQDLDGAIFPRTGSDISVSLQITPPYSLIRRPDWNNPETHLDENMFRWLEFYKWNFRANWFFNPVANLVVSPRIRFGAIGRFNDNMRYTPFERFKLGGDGMAMFSFAGVETIGMRGYTNESLSTGTGDLAFNRLTLEVRYPLTLNPAATIFALAFVEAGNSWENPRRINPFQNYRSAGVGIRLFLAAMGMFGLDWAYGFDGHNRGLGGSQFHFSINQSLD